MNLSVKEGNHDITHILLKYFTNNKIITIPRKIFIEEIIINREHYSTDSTLFIDVESNQVYSSYPLHIKRLQPKIIILIICHYSQENMMMLDLIRRSIYKNCKNNNVQYFIVASRFSETNPKIMLEDDILFINQREIYFNILNKTIKAIEYIDQVLQIQYDFLIRTNISTVINIPRLLSELAIIPKNNICIGGNKMQITWTCDSYGITDNRYKERWFIQGTSMVFSKDVCSDIIKNQHKIEKTVVDDISIFMFLSNFNKKAYESIHKYNISFYECSQSLEDLHKIPRDFAFYRNKTDNMREEDITRIRFLCNMLL